MKLTDYDWSSTRIGEAEGAADPGATNSDAGTSPVAIADCASGPPCPDLQRLSHSAGVDASSLTDDQIAEALLQLR